MQALAKASGQGGLRPEDGLTHPTPGGLSTKGGVIRANRLAL